MAERKVIVRCPSSSSPPPNCAICLGTFSNKCFSDSCMHQFCFSCLLEWSKIKAECPLCKQPFTRIIHNVKSNEEYDEHVVEITPPEEVHIIDNEEYLILPLGQPQQSTRHHFHFRTTFTVDTHGEHAIQQMLLTHPQISVSTSGYPTAPRFPTPPRNLFHNRRRRENSTTTSFRRSIYIRDLWVIAPPDVTGRYRDVSPRFFRSFPGARTRLAPWLNRELNALLYENTQLVMRLVDIIMEHLLRYHICSRPFRNLLYEYLDNKTDHFIHEFFNFMRSPFDMIGYDRHVIYSERPQSPHVVTLPDDVSDSGHDSDVIIVGSSNPQEPVVIDLLDETDSDEPILVPDDSPAPVLISIQDNSPEPEREARTPILPLKLRLKHKRRSREEEREKRFRKRSRRLRSSSSESPWESVERHRRKKKVKKVKRRRISSSESDANYSTDSDDNLPLAALLVKRKKELRRKFANANNSRTQNETKESSENERTNLPSCSRVDRWELDAASSSSSSRLPNLRSTCLKEEPTVDHNVPTCSRYSYTPPLPSTSGIKADDTSDKEYVPYSHVKSEIKRIKSEHPGKVKSSERLRNIMIKKEDSGNMWYSYQQDYDSSDNEGYEQSRPLM